MPASYIPRLIELLNPLRSSLRRNFVWTFAGNMVFSACQWSILSLLAKLTTPEVVGKYALALAIAAPLMMVANFNIGVMLVTDTERTFRFADYRFLRVGLIAIIILIAMPVIALICHFSVEVTLIILVVGLIQAVDCYSELHYSVMQRSERMNRIATSLITRGLISLVLAGLVLFYSHQLLWAVIVMAIVRLLVLFAYDIPMCSETEVSVEQPLQGSWLNLKHPGLGNPRSAVQIAGTAFPLAVVTTLTVLNLNMPRYFIEHYVGHRDLGIFAAMWSLLTAGNMVVIALCQAMFPRLSKLYAAGDLQAFKKLLWRGIQVGCTIGLLGVAGSSIAGRQILSLVYRPEYAERHGIFTALMAVGTLLYVISLLGYGATSARAFKNQAILMGTVVVATFAASALLIPRLGLIGAVWAVAIGLSIHIVGLAFVLTRILRKRESGAIQPVLSIENV